MNLIDLSQPLYDHMPVYPGDPEVEIKQVLTIAKDGWNMNTISLPAHIATHVNVPIHGVEHGKTLDDFAMDSFMGPAVMFQNIESVQANVGLLFPDATISDEVIQKIITVKPKFIGVQGYFESESELANEKLLLKADIISYEGLVNIDKLPVNTTFTFYGFPLKIKAGDGSPVRAVAVIV